ncbi:thioredoxin family protein [uncultured Chitinophaga sp.]|uniref:thioredoxin family protein n=1 Tax=uncultured Chitinophaga sp. TaxID=339340 RepID=UPI0025F76C47|nr:thioredoxin family protein [uncultured Chitinophaga sp.]
MKLRLLSVFMLLSVAVIAQQKTPPSTADIIKEATKIAGKENKKVFLIFHASWCGWCHQMDTAMNSASCKPLFDKSYVVRHVVVKESPAHKAEENSGGEALMATYGAAQSGIPYWIIFDKNGKAIADSQVRPEGADIHTTGKNTGCPASKEEVAYFEKVLKATSNLKESEIATIAARFRQIGERMNSH